MPERSLLPTRAHYALIFTVSLALLVQEIAVARVLSVAMLSHYAFVAISLAMFGLGLSGLIVYLLPQHFTAERIDEQLSSYARGFAITAPLSMIAFLQINVVQTLSIEGFLSLSLAYLLLAVPFFLGGTCVALLMTHFSASISRLYWADLVGASIGCLAVVLMMQVLPAPKMVLVVAILAMVASLGISQPSRPNSARTRVVSLVLVALFLSLGSFSSVFEIRYVKGADDYSVDYAAWNAFSRVGAFFPKQSAGQVAARDYAGDDYMMLDIDGAAWTPMMRFDGNPESIQFLRRDPQFSVHHLKSDADVLIIGTGGGRDILAALAFRQQSIQGIELNPLMRHMVEERYGDYSGRPYSYPGVNVIIDEARSRLHQIERRFDIIQLSLIDTFSLNAAGGFVFSENHLYTKEAFQEYYRHLNEDGVLSVTRYFVDWYPLEILRVLALVRSAWAAEGVPSIADHVLVVRKGLSVTVLAKRTPFTNEELKTFGATVVQYGIGIPYAPGQPPAHVEIGEIIRTPDLDAYTAAYPYRIDAPTDDQPFFFSFLRGRLKEVPRVEGDPFPFLEMWNEALSLMYLLIAVVVSAATVFFFGPLLFLSKRGNDLAAGRTAAYLLYFACLGYGFMMIEIPILQRFILFLGHPVYALAVVLFTLLLFSGTGSLLTGRFSDPARTNLIRVLGAIVISALIYTYGLPPIVSSQLSAPIAMRIAMAVVLLAPLGLLLGMAYPLGIRVLREESEELVPWAWAMNGAASVVASVLATFIAARVGFTTALLTGIAAYAIALGCIVSTARKADRGLTTPVTTD